CRGCSLDSLNWSDPTAATAAATTRTRPCSGLHRVRPPWLLAMLRLRRPGAPLPWRRAPHPPSSLLPLSPPPHKAPRHPPPRRPPRRRAAPELGGALASRARPLLVSAGSGGWAGRAFFSRGGGHSPPLVSLAPSTKGERGPPRPSRSSARSQGGRTRWSPEHG